MLSDIERRYKFIRAYDYDSGGMWLRRGRKKTTRPLYHKSLYISSRANNSLGIHFKSWGPDLIRYVPGDKAVIALPPSFSYPSTRDAVRIYANLVDVTQRKGKLFIAQDTDTFTKIRKVRCPKCLGRGLHWYQCNGLIQDTRKTKPSGFRGREVRSFSGMTYWVYKCECLDSNPDLDPNNHRASFPCNFCNSNGYRELGGIRQSFEWNGDPLVINLKTGRIEKIVNSNNQLVDFINNKGGI